MIPKKNPTINNSGYCLLLKLLLGVMFLSAACSSRPESPKPCGYFRIALPQHQYQDLEFPFPFSFSYPSYAIIDTSNIPDKQKYWFNMEIPLFTTTLYCSYKPIEGNLSKLINDSHEFVAKHISKATYIEEKLVINRQEKVYGLVFELSGSETASPYQFFLTDSVNHFFRGALYFNVRPNNDSLAPVIDFLREDLEHLINSFSWN